MVSVFRYHEISESSHRIMNPLSVDKLRLLGDVCRIAKGTRLLDLACGKGEMLCLFARDLGTSGVGIDIHGPFLADARARATELGVERAVTFIEGDAGDPPEIDGGQQFARGGHRDAPARQQCRGGAGEAHRAADRPEAHGARRGGDLHPRPEFRGDANASART